SRAAGRGRCKTVQGGPPCPACRLGRGASAAMSATDASTGPVRRSRGRWAGVREAVENQKGRNWHMLGMRNYTREYIEYHFGDEIKLNEAGFLRICEAFFAEIERECL